jgi:hypothetical protein
VAARRLGQDLDDPGEHLVEVGRRADDRDDPVERVAPQVAAGCIGLSYGAMLVVIPATFDEKDH